MFSGKINRLIHTLFFLAVFFVPAKTLFAVDIADEQLRLFQEVENPREIIGEVEDVSFDTDLSDEEIQRILIEVPKSVSDKKAEAQRKKQLSEQQRIAKLQETEVLKAQKEQERLAKQKEREQRLALEKQRQVQLAAEKERLAKEIATLKAEEEKKAERKKQLAEQQRLEKEKEAETLKVEKEKIQLASVQKKKLETPVQNGSVRKKLTLKKLKEKLGLTDKQLERLVPIMKEKAGRRREVLNKYAGKGEATRPALKQELLLFQKYYDDMYSHILSKEQWEKYMAVREEQKQTAQ